MAEGFDGIGGGGPDSLKAHGEQRDHERRGGGQQERPDPDRGAVGEAREPAVHGPIGQRPGHDIGQQHPLSKLCREHVRDLGDRGSQDLAYADLFGALFRRKRCQPEQAQAGDKDCDEREGSDDGRSLGFLGIYAADVLVQEGILERAVRRNVFQVSSRWARAVGMFWPLILTATWENRLGQCRRISGSMFSRRDAM